MIFLTNLVILSCCRVRPRPGSSWHLGGKSFSGGRFSRASPTTRCGTTPTRYRSALWQFSTYGRHRTSAPWLLFDPLVRDRAFTNLFRLFGTTLHGKTLAGLLIQPLNQLQLMLFTLLLLALSGAKVRWLQLKKKKLRNSLQADWEGKGHLNYIKSIKTYLQRYPPGPGLLPVTFSGNEKQFLLF